jgi:5-methylcytosine-specific restriction enzyme A
MAVTKGHGNPKWSREETILALHLYFECQDHIPSPKDKRVVELSNTLRKFPYQAKVAKKPSFRNPDGVVFKLQNLRQVATGKGLANVSTMDKQIWAEFGDDATETAKVSAAITGSLASMPNLSELDDIEDEEFREGRLLTTTHRKRERNPRVRKQLIEVRSKLGALSCDLCHCSSPLAGDDSYADSIFEAHHVVPLGEGNTTTTHLKDLALLCANCHRLLHRKIAREKKWTSVAHAREAFGF